MKAENKTIVRDIYNYIDTIAPFCSQASWDNSGLLVGNPEGEVTKVLFALDVTEIELEYAKKVGAQLIVSHHPVIFSAQKNFLEGDLSFQAARNGISVLCAHTNLDKAVGGVNDTLCDMIGFPYEKIADDVAEGFLNVAYTNKAYSAERFAEFLSKKLSAAVRFCDVGKAIEKFAVCSGAGSDFINDAKKLGCNALVTGDASYHDFLDAKEKGLSLFAAGHFETEVIIVEKLKEIFIQQFPFIEFYVSKRENPVVTVK